MDPIFSIKDAVKQLFNPGVTQKHVRNISKDLSSVKPSDIDALTTECGIRLKGIIKEDPIQAIHLVTVLSEGAPGIQNGIIECLEEILKLLFENLRCIDNIPVSSKYSTYHDTLKALFNILQYVMPNITEEENSCVYYNLRQIFYLLYEIIESEKVPLDSYMVVGTSLSLLITYLNHKNRGKTFITLMYLLVKKKGIQSLLNAKYESSLESDSDYIHMNKEINTENYLENVEASYKILLLINGLINSNLSWLYENLHFDYENVDHLTILQRKENTLQEANVQCAKKNEEKKDSLNCEDYNPLLYKLFPIIYKCCNSSSNYNFIAFQTLYMWIKCVRKLGKHILLTDKDFENVKSIHVEVMYKKKNQFFNENHILPNYSQHPAKLSLFAVTSENSRSVFAFLNANWESPVKGVSEIVRDSTMELLEMHGDAHKGHKEILAMQMLSALVEGAAWGSKSTYPPLELAVHYVGAQKALELYPDLACALTGCLSINHLASPATCVYKLMLTHLTMELWSKYFMQHFLNSLLNTDRVTRQQALSLWLPPTLSRYPQLTTQLLTNFEDSTEGWVAKMSVLKIARSIGILHLENTILLKNKNKSGDCKEDFDSVTNMITDTPKMGDDCLNDMIEKIKFGLCHIDEMVRTEAFDLICKTQKTSEPFTLSETILIKHFFTYNMNIDSSCFRQNILKTFKCLMVRVRDSCINQLKKSPYRYLGSENIKHELMVKYEANECLKTNCELLLWLMRNFHRNFAPDSNYQRRILCLQLYKELLLSFYEHENCSYRLSSRCKILNMFITKYGGEIEKGSFLSNAYTNSSEVYNLNNSSFFLYSEKNEVNFNGFTLPWTHEILYNACLDDMNDVKEEAELILQIIQSENRQINIEETSKWFKYGLSLCDSPKASEAESGAALVRIIDLALASSGITPIHIFKELGVIIEDENIFCFLLRRLEKQFEIAQNNLLRAAMESPIHGTVMALNRCLSQTVLNAGKTGDKLIMYFTRLSGILISLVEFMLKNLALASSGGSAIAPSFAEMSESIELIIKECMQKDPSLLDKKRESEYNCRLEETLSVNDVADSASISGNHHLVLSCCWQTIKMCCLISSRCIKHCPSSLFKDTTESLLRHVMVRVLTGTRHKGAMEAAKAAYAQACTYVLSSKANIGTFIHGQVYEVLDQLEAGAETSITRRGAGLAMMLDAACGAAPRCSAHLIDTTVKRLINIANMDNVDDGKMDASPAVSLHILQSLVLNASLARNIQGHLPNITITCITAFSSSSWGKRNAALQLYGSVVPRMVGQKKVKEDSSAFNSITAPEFLSRYPVLANFLLHILSKVCFGENEKIIYGAMKPDAGLLGNRNVITYSSDKELNSIDSIFSGANTVAQASYLVPVLSLLSRLSPGTGLQQNPQLSKTLQNYSSVTLAMMKSPVHTVRRLASLALISLTPTREIPLLLEKILDTIRNSDNCRSTNLVHGYLLILQNIVHFYPEIYEHNSNKSKILESLKLIMLAHKDCLVIKTIALKLYTDWEPQQMIKTEIRQNSKPGGADYIRKVTALNLHHSVTKYNLERYFFSSCQDEMEMCIRFIEEKILINKENEILAELYENIIWKRLEIESIQNYKQVSPVLKLFIVFLNNYSSLKYMPSEKSIYTLHSLLSGTVGLFVSAQALKIASYIIKVFPEKIFGKDIFLKEYVSKINSFANPVSTEDYRLAAAESLIVSLNTLLNNNLLVLQIETLIVACVNLLQDEESEVRNIACKIVYTLSFCRSPYVNQLQNSNMSLKTFIYGISIHYIHLGDLDMLQILWKLCHGPLLQNLQSPSEILENDVSSYLFQSHTMNLYMEPKNISLTIAQAVMFAMNQHNQMSHNPLFQKWIIDQLKLIDKEGEAVKYYLKMEKIHLSKRQKLLVFINRYIIASQLLVQIANTVKMTLMLQHPLQFDNNHYCFLSEEDLEPK